MLPRINEIFIEKREILAWYSNDSIEDDDEIAVCKIPCRECKFKLKDSCFTFSLYNSSNSTFFDYANKSK